ncbi:dromyosuppressin [Condylostylus longicornis]|uniref:dromyosuppressin n=1 Tax=Condylostylus longicornis TaxID=2530218 RepID=UPI00244E2FEC|nr:dromyosuppressin [Condylostylus longicornis]
MPSQIGTTIFLAFMLFVTITQSYQATTPTLCEPGVLEEMPQHIKKVCIALENSNQLSNALNAYIKNEALMLKSDDLLTANNGKRTDVDHVFLRFGRRR